MRLEFIGPFTCNTGGVLRGLQRSIKVYSSPQIQNIFILLLLYNGWFRRPLVVAIPGQHAFYVLFHRFRIVIHPSNPNIFFV